jgi:hypothetical protein
MVRQVILKEIGVEIFPPLLPVKKGTKKIPWFDI